MPDIDDYLTIESHNLPSRMDMDDLALCVDDFAKKMSGLRYWIDELIAERDALAAERDEWRAKYYGLSGNEPDGY